jgi:hypothetical protein
MWAREEEFKALLHKAVTKASKSAIESLTDLAVADEAWVSCEVIMPAHGLAVL